MRIGGCHVVEAEIGIGRRGKREHEKQQAEGREADQPVALERSLGPGGRGMGPCKKGVALNYAASSPPLVSPVAKTFSIQRLLDRAPIQIFHASSPAKMAGMGMAWP